MSDKPLVFLSHKHEDRKLADVVRDFIEERSLGSVEVFQSSESGQGLRIGREVDEELMANLLRAEVLLLLYTTRRHDWSFCMWECGVALDPGTRDTEIVVFQCTDDVPEPFEDEVRVDIRQESDVHRFVNTFFTDPSFFPRLGRALTGWAPGSEEVEGIAADLFQELQRIGTVAGWGPVDESEAFARLTLRLPLELEEPIRAADREVASQLVLEAATVYACDQESAGHFGRPRIGDGTLLRDVIDAWRRDATHEPNAWVGNLLDQVARAVLGKSPHTAWHVLRGEESRSWVAPTVYRFRRMPGRARFEFDVLFIPFSEGPSGSLDIVVPPELDRWAPSNSRQSN